MTDSHETLSVKTIHPPIHRRPALHNSADLRFFQPEAILLQHPGCCQVFRAWHPHCSGAFCISMVLSLLVSIRTSDYLTGPEGFEEVGHVIEVHITAAAADTVPGHNDLLGERMLLRELRYSLLVIVVNVLL